MAISVSPASASVIDGLAGADDLPRLARHRGDDAALSALQRRVADRIRGLAQLRLRRLERRGGRIQLVAPDVVGGLRDDRLRQQRLGALEIVARHVAAGARRGDRGSGAVLGELQIGVVEPGDHLTDLDAVADVDGALHDLAGHAKADGALDPGPHDAGIGQRARRGRRLATTATLTGRTASSLDLGLALAAAAARRRHDQGMRDQPSRSFPLLTDDI